MNQPSSRQHTRNPMDRTFYLPRLPREYYQGDAVIHWTRAVSHRKQGWLLPEFHGEFRELMFHAAAREGLLCPIYCLMPDHIHLVWMGLRRQTDQMNGMKILRTYLEPALKSAKFQHQPQDNVLRAEERKRGAFASVCFYIAANPIRADLISSTGSWPYIGCIVPGYPKLNPVVEDFWPVFWKLYAKLRSPDAGSIERPPRA